MHINLSIMLVANLVYTIHDSSEWSNVWIIFFNLITEIRHFRNNLRLKRYVKEVVAVALFVFEIRLLGIINPVFFIYNKFILNLAILDLVLKNLFLPKSRMVSIQKQIRDPAIEGSSNCYFMSIWGPVLELK